MSIAANILEIVKESLIKSDFEKVSSITVQIGELTAVVPESLRFCFDMAIDNTPFKGAKLQIIEVPLAGECKECGERFNIKNYNFLCPICQSIQIKITNGQELCVTELEVE
jgi:hydrogenase nickel incorporation protein HypA/HybF